MTQQLDTIACEGRRLRGLAPCCGTTNLHCDRHPRRVTETPTGCDNCGHPAACHDGVAGS